jgi:osmotically-inducible protein OsmY
MLNDGQESLSCDPATEATERLRASPYLPLRNLTCHARDGALVLHGKVPTFYLKSLAQELVTSVEGVADVVNQIEVQLLGGPTSTV